MKDYETDERFEEAIWKARAYYCPMCNTDGIADCVEMVEKKPYRLAFFCTHCWCETDFYTNPDDAVRAWVNGIVKESDSDNDVWMIEEANECL